METLIFFYQNDIPQETAESSKTDLTSCLGMRTVSIHIYVFFCFSRSRSNSTKSRRAGVCIAPPAIRVQESTDLSEDGYVSDTSTAEDETQSDEDDEDEDGGSSEGEDGETDMTEGSDENRTMGISGI